MAQHDMVVDNADGLTVRTDFNAAIQALVTCSSGVTEPPDRFPGMLWLDLSVGGDGVLRQRNQGNTAWLPVLLPPDFRFPAADLFFGARTVPNRFVWNNVFDGSGTDVMQLFEDGVLRINGAPVAANDVPTKGYVDTIGMPVGAVIYVAMATPPTNYLKCNGASILRDSAPALFLSIGTTYGSVDGTHFNVPDLRGEFIRGWDDGRGIDAGRLIGSSQNSEFASHTHTAGVNNVNHVHTFADSTTTSTAPAHAHGIAGNTPYTGGNALLAAASSRSDSSATQQSTQAGAHSHTFSVSGTTGGQNVNHTHIIDPAGGADTRPRNVAQLACIKWQ